MKYIILFVALFGMAMAQDEEPVKPIVVWPQNDDTRGGAIVAFAYSNVKDGSCVAKLPSMVNLFHVMNAHIVPGDLSSPAEGQYQITAPAEWEAINGTVNALIIFDRDAIFNITDIIFTCDPENVAELSLYSFPQNNLMKEASSNVYYRPGFHQGDVLTVTLPQQVASFNFTTMDSEYEVSAEGTTYTLSGFKNEVGIDDMKEVHFSITYAPSDDDSTWFSAADVTVSVNNVGVVVDEEDVVTLV